jgi:hypothetical protein
MSVLVSAVVVVVTTMMLAAAVAAALVRHGPRHNARRAGLPVALRLLQRVELADLLLLKLLQLPALLLERSNALVSLAIGGVASGDGALLLLTCLREESAERLNLKLEFLAGLLVWTRWSLRIGP